MEQIIQDELLTKTQESISSEQHGFYLDVATLI